MANTTTSKIDPFSPEIKAKALLVNDRLCAEYGCPIPYFHELDPLSELVSSLLSHRTKNADSGRAFRQLPRPVCRLADRAGTHRLPRCRKRLRPVRGRSKKRRVYSRFCVL